MTPDYLSTIGQIISQAGASAIVGFVFVFYLWNEKRKGKTLVINDKSRKNDTDQVAEELKEHESIDSQQTIDISTLRTMLEMHVKENESAFGVMHNGLNTYNQTLKDINKTLQDYRVMVEKLATTIEERIPRKG